MNDDLTRFECQLRAIQVRQKTDEGAELFYRCGYEAARRHGRLLQGRTVTFLSGTLSGIAAATLVVVGLNLLPSNELAGPSTVAIEEEPSAQPIVAVTLKGDNDAQPVPDAVVEEHGEALRLTSFVPWNWETPSEPGTEPQSGTPPLSAAANRQWLSVIEDSPYAAATVSPGTSATGDNRQSPIRPQPLDEKMLRDFL